MNIEKVKRLAANTLDVVTQEYEEIRVAFHSSEEDLSYQSPTVTVRIVGNCAMVSGSRCLPAYRWGVVAEAYGRAASFLRRSGLKDGRYTVNKVKK